MMVSLFMHRSIFLIISFLCSVYMCATARQESIRNVEFGELRKLLSLPAPTPRAAEKKQDEKPPRSPDFYNSANPPPDDAPAADLLDYWESNSDSDDPPPSEVVRQRLLAACEDEPERLPRLLNLLSQNA